MSLSDGVSTSRSYVATGLTNGATYQFRVAARNAVGWSRVSNVVTAAPTAPFLAMQLIADTTSTSASTSVPATTTSTTTSTTTVPPVEPSAPSTTLAPTTSAVSEVSTIGDIVWLDANSDGLQQLDEAGIEGVVVVLLDGANVELARNVTDHHGAYEFTDVAAGSYVLELKLPDGYAITQADQGFDDDLDSDLVSVDEQRGTTRTDVIALPADRADGFDLGLILAPVDVPEPTTTAAPAVTTTTAALPSTTAATTEAPTTDAPTTTLPPTEVPTTQPPTTTQAPTTQAPTTQAPTTQAPTTRRRRRRRRRPPLRRRRCPQHH